MFIYNVYIQSYENHSNNIFKIHIFHFSEHPIFNDDTRI